MFIIEGEFSLRQRSSPTFHWSISYCEIGDLIL